VGCSNLSPSELSGGEDESMARPTRYVVAGCSCTSGGAESEARRGCTWRGAASGGLLPCRPCRQRARRVRPCAHRAAPAVSLRPRACLVRVFPGPQCRRSAVCAPAPGSLQWACGRALCARASCAFGCARRTWGPGGRPGVWGGVTGNGASGTVDSRV
jgi:hypothetical protein